MSNTFRGKKKDGSRYFYSTPNKRNVVAKNDKQSDEAQPEGTFSPPSNSTNDSEKGNDPLWREVLSQCPAGDVAEFVDQHAAPVVSMVSKASIPVSTSVSSVIVPTSTVDPPTAHASRNDARSESRTQQQYLSLVRLPAGTSLDQIPASYLSVDPTFPDLHRNTPTYQRDADAAMAALVRVATQLMPDGGRGGDDQQKEAKHKFQVEEQDEEEDDQKETVQRGNKQEENSAAASDRSSSKQSGSSAGVNTPNNKERPRIVASAETVKRLFAAALHPERPLALRVRRLGPLIVLDDDAMAAQQRRQLSTTSETLRAQALLAKALYHTRNAALGGNGNERLLMAAPTQEGESIRRMGGPAHPFGSTHRSHRRRISGVDDDDHDTLQTWENESSFAHVIRWHLGDELDLVLGTDSPLLHDLKSTTSKEKHKNFVTFRVIDTSHHQSAMSSSTNINESTNECDPKNGQMIPAPGTAGSTPLFSPADALDAWFDATLAAASSVAILVHHDGTVERYDVMSPQEVLTHGGGAPVARKAAEALHFTGSTLRWIVNSCRDTTGTYLVVREGNRDNLQSGHTLQLFQVGTTSTSETQQERNEAKPPKKSSDEDVPRQNTLFGCVELDPTTLQQKRTLALLSLPVSEHMLFEQSAPTVDSAVDVLTLLLRTCRLLLDVLAHHFALKQKSRQKRSSASDYGTGNEAEGDAVAAEGICTALRRLPRALLLLGRLANTLEETVNDSSDNNSCNHIPATDQQPGSEDAGFKSWRTSPVTWALQFHTLFATPRAAAALGAVRAASCLLQICISLQHAAFINTKPLLSAASHEFFIGGRIKKKNALTKETDTKSGKTSHKEQNAESISATDAAAEGRRATCLVLAAAACASTVLNLLPFITTNRTPNSPLQSSSFPVSPTQSRSSVTSPEEVPPPFPSSSALMVHPNQAAESQCLFLTSIHTRVSALLSELVGDIAFLGMIRPSLYGDIRAALAQTGAAAAAGPKSGDGKSLGAAVAGNRPQTPLIGLWEAFGPVELCGTDEASIVRLSFRALIAWAKLANMNPNPNSSSESVTELLQNSKRQYRMQLKLAALHHLVGKFHFLGGRLTKAFDALTRATEAVQLSFRFQGSIRELQKKQTSPNREHRQADLIVDDDQEKDEEATFREECGLGSSWSIAHELAHLWRIRAEKTSSNSSSGSPIDEEAAESAWGQCLQFRRQALDHQLRSTKLSHRSEHSKKLRLALISDLVAFSSRQAELFKGCINAAASTCGTKKRSHVQEGSKTNSATSIPLSAVESTVESTVVHNHCPVANILELYHQIEAAVSQVKRHQNLSREERTHLHFWERQSIIVTLSCITSAIRVGFCHEADNFPVDSKTARRKLRRKKHISWANEGWNIVKNWEDQLQGNTPLDELLQGNESKNSVMTSDEEDEVETEEVEGDEEECRQKKLTAVHSHWPASMMLDKAPPKVKVTKRERCRLLHFDEPDGMRLRDNVGNFGASILEADLFKNTSASSSKSATNGKTTQKPSSSKHGKKGSEEKQSQDDEEECHQSKLPTLQEAFGILLKVAFASPPMSATILKRLDTWRLFKRAAAALCRHESRGAQIRPLWEKIISFPTELTTGVPKDVAPVWQLLNEIFDILKEDVV